MYKYWLNTARTKHAQENLWLGKLTTLDLTQMGWLGRKTSTQTNMCKQWRHRSVWTYVQSGEDLKLWSLDQTIQINKLSGTLGDWVHLGEFLPAFTRETTFVTSPLLSYTPSLLWKGSTLVKKEKKCCQGSRFFPSRIDPFSEGRQKLLKSCLLWKFMSSPYLLHDIISFEMLRYMSELLAA